MEKRGGRTEIIGNENQRSTVIIYIYVYMRVFDDFCFASLCKRFEERSIASFETRTNGAKRKRKMVRAIITATLLSSHRINIIRCIV